MTHLPSTKHAGILRPKNIPHLNTLQHQPKRGRFHMERNQNEKSEVARYAILTQAILHDKRLNSTDKIVLARISGFSRFFESSEATAEFCGLGVRQVQDSKRKLEKLGFVTVLVNTGRGKALRTAPDYLWTEVSLTEQRKSDLRNSVSHTYEKTETENKERIKREKNNKGADAPAVNEKEKANEPKTYGNQQVNEFLQAWKEETGDDFSKDTRERRATWNLIKGKTSEATKALLTAVGEARRSGDRFAPRIASPSDLVGKYSKINKLRLWVSRNEENEEPHPPYWSWQKLPPQDDLTDEERAATQQAFKEARASGKYKWLKPKEENDAE